MSMSLSSSSSARERRNRRIAAFQHRGRMFQQSIGKGGGAAGGGGARSDEEAAPFESPTTALLSCADLEGSVIPAPASPPSSPNPYKPSGSSGHSSEEEGETRSGAPPHPSSPRTPRASSGAFRPLPPGKAKSPLLPYVSPSRSIDDGDERPPPLSSPSPLPLQQPNLSPRFRSSSPSIYTGAAVVGLPKHHQAPKVRSDRSVVSLAQLDRSTSSPLLLMDDRSVASESDLLLLKPCPSIDSIEENRLRLHLQHGSSKASAAADSTSSHPSSSRSAADLVVDWRNLVKSPEAAAAGAGAAERRTVKSLSLRLPTAELRPRPSAGVRPSHRRGEARSSRSKDGGGTENRGGTTEDDGCGGDDDDDDDDDAVSSLGDQDDSLLIPSPPRAKAPRHRQASLDRLTRAILRGSDSRPAGLDRDECFLWEAVQLVLAQKGDSSSTRLAAVEGKCPGSPLTPSALLGDDYENVPNHCGGSAVAEPGEGKLLASATYLLGTTGPEALQERQDAAAMREIQRILADVTSERDEMHKQLLLRPPPDTRPSQKSPPATTSSDSGGEGVPGGERAILALEAELTRRNCRIRDLERELSQRSNFSLTPPRTASSVSTSPSSRHEGETRHDDPGASVQSPHLSRSGSIGDEASSISSDDAAQLQKLKGDLRDKSSALESAKMIIASLEIASGSMAADMRAKLKTREDELAAIKIELGDKQRSLDSIATQLRDVQRSQSYARYSHLRDEERSRRLGLSSRLEKNMADFRAALVVLESTTQDSTSLELISSLLSDTILAMKDGIDMLDENIDADDSALGGWGDSSSSSSGMSSTRGGAVSMDARKLRQELDEKSQTIHRLEEALRREREECTQLRAEREASDSKRQQELVAVRVEVQALKEQCYTNMEVLAKKERELVVLRDSLKVDDEVGYISDDGTDATESDVEETPMSPVPPIFKYGPSQAEALATLLAQSSAVSGSKSSVSTEAANELQVLKQELHQARGELERSRKQLKTEKESLVNAKMIISSLEKANKSIMDDLRARLQDSNTAITSLLEKSIENEQATSRLREEVEVLRNQKERYEAELSTLRPSYPGDSQLSLHGLICPLEEKKDDKPETID